MIEVTFIDKMGCDLDVVNDAKISFAKQAKHFGRFASRRSLQNLDEVVNRFLPQPLDDVGEKFAILAKTGMAKSIGNVVQGGLGHQG